MSKERAQRRAEREREAAVLAAAKAAEQERRERRGARRRALTARVPKRRPGQAGVLAERRRTEARLLVFVVVVLNLLVWLATDDWGVRVGVLLVSLLVAPLVQILMSRK